MKTPRCAPCDQLDGVQTVAVCRATDLTGRSPQFPDGIPCCAECIRLQAITTARGLPGRLERLREANQVGDVMGREVGEDGLFKRKPPTGLKRGRPRKNPTVELTIFTVEVVNEFPASPADCR